ncbi:DUF995 domain-containing protein [Mesorhizobium sp. CO1-1-11]|uniref:DUF995 domain-containing protein n=1 Tax=Mesorhizobium sp. CO1-1-11 TaxID=2876636 RepID=UPI001CCD3228|nr:DUF995 domain-containing protein [Mesorhizobium sp. CO1-1-11]MBZ9724615.1 DUF995 domain-containing protein [Mesorhizobium sp. CO1-1-11]
MPTLIVPIAPTRSPPHGVDRLRRRERRRSARFTLLLFVLALCGQVALPGTSHAAAAKDSAPAKADSAIAPIAATVPTAYELQLLYADRTWIWENGAAYFAKGNRRLEAWTSGQDSASVAEGRWLVTKDGKMCMDVAWRSKSYKGKQRRTCYSHRIKDGTIEQRKDPDGEWYSFKRTPEGPSDEYRKFESGDTKAARFEEARKLIDSKN